MSSSSITTGSSSQTHHYPLLSLSTHLQIKLTKDNYLSWKTAITPYINGNKILHHIDNGLTSLLQSIRYVNTCLILLMITGVLSSVFYAILNTPSIMVYFSTATPHFPYKHSLILIGLVVLMIVVLQPVTASTLAVI